MFRSSSFSSVVTQVNGHGIPVGGTRKSLLQILVVPSWAPNLSQLMGSGSVLENGKGILTFDWDNCLRPPFLISLACTFLATRVFAPRTLHLLMISMMLCRAGHWAATPTLSCITVITSTCPLLVKHCHLVSMGQVWRWKGGVVL